MFNEAVCLFKGKRVGLRVRAESKRVRVILLYLGVSVLAHPGEQVRGTDRCVIADTESEPIHGVS